MAQELVKVQLSPQYEMCLIKVNVNDKKRKYSQISNSLEETSTSSEAS